MGAKIVVLLLVGLLLSVACSNSASTNASLERSSDPVMLPAPPFQEAATFTIYKNWTNQYELRYNQSIGATDNFIATQFSDQSTGQESSESPNDNTIAEAMRASQDDRCSVVEPASGMRLCVYEDLSYLVRVFEVDGRQLTLVANYFDNPAAAAGDPAADRHTFNPDSIEARVMSSDFIAVPVGEAAKTSLEVVS